MADRLLTPSKITAWLDCAHYLSLAHGPGRNGGSGDGGRFGSFARLLQDKGLEHEAAVLEQYRHSGLSIVQVEQKQTGESFSDWADRTAGVLDSEDDVLFQVPLVHDGVRGVADFLIRRGGEPARWEPVDAKLARSAAKPAHVLQLCFYAEALEAATGATPELLAVSLGSGAQQTVRYFDVAPYWRRLRGQLRTAMELAPGSGNTRPVPCEHCEFCEFQVRCDDQLRAEDSLHFVAGIRTDEIEVLEAADVETLEALATSELAPEGLRAERLERIRTQAALQLEARAAPGSKPPHRLVERVEGETWGSGFDMLPRPDAADVFLDFEGHPFWRPDRGLFFLFGYIASNDGSTWDFQQLWAEDEAEERERVRELVNLLHARWKANPGMHVYHYNHTERSSLERLSAEYAVAEGALGEMLDAGVFVDLLLVVRNAVQLGVESYSLKEVERVCDFERAAGIDRGAGAVIAFEHYTRDRDPEHKESIAAYNEDDVRALLALRDWLMAVRPEDLEWPAPEEIEEPEAHELDVLLDRLAERDGAEFEILADLLGYWRREWRAQLAPVLVQLCGPTESLLEADNAIGGLVASELLAPEGRQRKPRLRLAFPGQQLGREFTDGEVRGLLYVTPEGRPCFASCAAIDVDAGTIDITWDDDPAEAEPPPVAVVLNDWVRPDPKPRALNELAEQFLDPTTHGEPNPATRALIEAEPPRFRDGGGPPGGLFGDDHEELAGWVVDLDRSVLAVQGPPGTGKTFRGAHMARRLIAAGKRVGIMAMSHAAIDNFLSAVVDVCASDPSAHLRALRKGNEPAGGGLPGVDYTTRNADLADGGYNLVAATSWQFAGKDLRGAPVDFLLIDEAGQLSLVDAVVASMSARSVVLLGDPLQLPQVTKAVHPGAGGASAIGHVLGEDHTIPADRGVFIEESRRMHPDICGFISERIYDGRLRSHADCATQRTDAGTGLRWIRTEHEGCSTEAPEEAAAVADQIRRLMGRSWTDQQGSRSELGPGDFMVVVPYNDQRRLLEAVLGAEPATRGVPVGTVDKFQGQQAPVVLFSMTSSSAADIARGTDFLFSRNRLNVAISRAQCLAYLVCTEELLDSRARTVEDMLLMATLCAFVEAAR